MNRHAKKTPLALPVWDLVKTHLTDELKTKTKVTLVKQ
jgi:hypothetical protein